MKSLITIYEGPLPYNPRQMGLEFATIYSSRVHVEGPVRGYEIFELVREGSVEYRQGEQGFAHRDAQDLLPAAYRKALDEIIITANSEKEKTKIVILANPLRKKKITIADLTVYPKDSEVEADQFKYQGKVDVMIQMIGYRRRKK